MTGLILHKDPEFWSIVRCHSADGAKNNVTKPFSDAQNSSMVPVVVIVKKKKSLLDNIELTKGRKELSKHASQVVTNVDNSSNVLPIIVVYEDPLPTEYVLT